MSQKSPVSRRGFLCSAAVTSSFAMGAGVRRSIVASEKGRKNETLIQSITKETISKNRDGKGKTWFHPRACMIPGENGQPKIFMNQQVIGGSDYFETVCWSESCDLGATWTKPKPIAPLGRIAVATHPGLKAGVCDVTPQYHEKTNTILAMGHVVYYKGPKYSNKEQIARYPVYAVRYPDGSWSKRKILEWDDPRASFIYSNGCGQRIVMPNGDIMLSFTLSPSAKSRMVAGVRCSFDGEDLKIIEVGPVLKNEVKRGLLEPSITRFQDRFFMTIRAEDGNGYVATCKDGLNYKTKTPWKWDDGSAIKMSTTQQHWLTHSQGLFLVYNREDVTNKNVMRWRSPLWVAQVDPEKLCLIRSTEQVALPLVGDGINAPDQVALMGNFDVTNISETESMVTVGEWQPRNGAKGDLLFSRIKWNQPNKMSLYFQ